MGNPLGLADAVVKKDVRTIIFGINSPRDDGLDAANVIARDVLGIPGWEQRDAVFLNAGSAPGKADLSDSQVRQIDKFLINFDCGYRHLAFSNLVEFVPGTLGSSLFHHCNQNESVPGLAYVTNAEK